MNRVSSATKLNLRKVTHVIFDLDGTLLDTEKLYMKSIQNVLSQYGKDFTWADRVQVLGLSGPDAAKSIVQKFKLPVAWDQYYKSVKEQYILIMPDAELMPGAEKLVKHFHNCKVPIAVATSSGQDTYDVKVSRHQKLFSMFSHIVCGGSDPDVKTGKPAPDIFLVCAQRFKSKPKPADCLVIEDAPNGVLAALTAGMQVIMVPDKETDKELCKNATLTLSSLEEVKPEMWGLPPLKRS